MEFTPEVQEMLIQMFTFMAVIGGTTYGIYRAATTKSRKGKEAASRAIELASERETWLADVRAENERLQQQQTDRDWETFELASLELLV